MKHALSVRLGLLALPLVLSTLPATASDDCDAPPTRWQSREAVRQMADTRGWQIQRLKIDDGCYEIRATDAQGHRFKAKIDPETLKVMKIRRDDHHAPRTDRDDDEAGRRSRTPPPNAASAPAPVPTPGTTPRGQIE